MSLKRHNAIKTARLIFHLSKELKENQGRICGRCGEWTAYIPEGECWCADCRYEKARKTFTLCDVDEKVIKLKRQSRGKLVVAKQKLEELKEAA